jgi:hypothetical protein
MVGRREFVASVSISEALATGQLQAVPEGALLPLQLTPGTSNCPGESIGCLCLLLRDGETNPAMAQRLANALESLDCSLLLLTLPESNQPVRMEEDPTEMELLTEAWPLALLATVLALLAGLAIGLALRRLPGLWRWAAAAGLVGLCAGGAALEPLSQFGLGLWDSVVVVIGLMLSLLVTMQTRPGWRDIALLAASLLLSAVALEGACRLLPSPRIDPKHGEDIAAGTLPPDAHGWDPRKLLLYPDQFPEALEERVAMAEAAGSPGAPLVVHLGDSMVHGNSVPFQETFVGVLSQLDGHRLHLNAGIPGVSTDYEYLLFKQLTGRLTIDSVVLYMFAGNDLFEAGVRYPFCRMDRLLDFTGEKPLWTCPQPVGPVSFRHRLLAARPPALLRSLASHSVAARRLLRGFVALRLDTLPEARALSVIRSSLAALRDDVHARGIHLQVVILPDRTELELNYEQARRRREILLEVVGETGLDPIDSEPFLRALMGNGPFDSWFESEMPEDIHWSRATHERFAAWLRHRSSKG